MHLGHLALPLLTANGCLRSNTSSPQNPLSKPQVFCYRQMPEGTPQRAPTTYADCMNLALRIVQTGKPHAAVDFSRNKRFGIEVPHRLVHGTCVFEVDIREEKTREDSWAASYWEIGNAAIDIFCICVNKPPHLGGLTKVGRDQVLDLKVYGRRPSLKDTA